MQVDLIKTRWTFLAKTDDGRIAHHLDGKVIEGCVEFSRDIYGKKLACVYNLSGTQLLWSTTGVNCIDARTARMVFEVYAKDVARADSCEKGALDATG